MSQEQNTKNTWNAIIEKKLKEGSSIDDLKFTHDSGIVMEPNIVADDIKNIKHKLNISDSWCNMASLSGKKPNSLNILAHQALNQGANGLSFEVSSQEDLDFIMAGVESQYLEIRAISSKNIDVSLYENTRLVHPKHTMEITIPAAGKVDSYKQLLDGLKISSFYDIIISVGKNLLFEISAIRALRLLLNDAGFSKYKIIGSFDVEGNNELGDFNLIEKTYKTMSLILGGADTILTTYDGSEDSRLTLNIQNILDLESGFKNVLDPVSGAYYIEKLTNEIFQKVKSTD